MGDIKARIWRVYKEKVSKFIMQSKQKRRQYNLKNMKKKQLEDCRNLPKLQIKRGVEDIICNFEQSSLAIEKQSSKQTLQQVAAVKGSL